MIMMYPADLKTILKSIVRKKIYRFILSQKGEFNSHDVMKALSESGTKVEADELKIFLIILQSRKYIQGYKLGRTEFHFKLNERLRQIPISIR